VQALLDDWEQAPLTPRERALANYAAKLTKTPAAMTRADLDGLRSHGLEDADLLALVEVVGYYAYVNRIVDALGVELEDHSPA